MLRFRDMKFIIVKLKAGILVVLHCKDLNFQIVTRRQELLLIMAKRTKDNLTAKTNEHLIQVFTQAVLVL